VALERDDDAYRISRALRARGVIPDYRAPEIIRIAPIALYNSFHEVWRVVTILKEIIDQGDHERLPRTRAPIT
jgi:kynureninase